MTHTVKRLADTASYTMNAVVAFSVLAAWAAAYETNGGQPITISASARIVDVMDLAECVKNPQAPDCGAAIIIDDDTPAEAPLDVAQDRKDFAAWKKLPDFETRSRRVP